jgi:hypothetical protein
MSKRAIMEALVGAFGAAFRLRASLVLVTTGARGTSTARLSHSSLATSRCRKQSTTWSLTIPMACICA